MKKKFRILFCAALACCLIFATAATAYAKSGTVKETNVSTSTTTTTNTGLPDKAPETVATVERYVAGGVNYEVTTEVTTSVSGGTKTVTAKITTVKTWRTDNIEQYQNNTNNGGGNNSAQRPNQNQNNQQRPQCSGIIGCGCGRTGHLPNPDKNPGAIAIADIQKLLEYAKARSWNMGVDCTKCTKNQSVSTITFAHEKSGTMSVIQTATKDGVGYTLSDGVTYTDLASIMWSLEKYK